jgi:hypothetical protein
MKKDRLEQFIAENRDQFDLYDPGERVWNGIEKKVQKKHNNLNWKSIIWKAAAILVIFAASFLLQEYLHRNEMLSGRKDKKIKNVEIPELQEAEIYYTNLVDEKIEEIKPLLKNQPELSNDIKNDLAELDSTYAELQKDLIDNIANDEVVEAMIQNYRLKLQILEDLLGYLQQETSKNEQDENNESDI